MCVCATFFVPPRGVLRGKKEAFPLFGPRQKGCLRSKESARMKVCCRSRISIISPPSSLGAVSPPGSAEQKMIAFLRIMSASSSLLVTISATWKSGSNVKCDGSGCCGCTFFNERLYVCVCSDVQTCVGNAWACVCVCRRCIAHRYRV